MPAIGAVAADGTGLPGGGAAGQALTKTGGGNYAYGWADSGIGQPPEPIYQPGNWYDNRTQGGYAINTSVALALRNTGTYMPMWFPAPITVDAVGGMHYLYNGTAAPVTQAFYTSRPDNGMPGTLLGSFSFTPTAAAGNFRSGTGTPVVLPSGWVWMGLFTGATNDYNMSGASVVAVRFPQFNQGKGGPWSGPYDSQVYCFRSPAGTAAPPAVAPADVTAVYYPTGGGYAPVFCFRVA